jgi:hypothetical protein
MKPVWRDDRVVQTQPHGGMHDQVRERGGGVPGCLFGFDPVRAWRFGGVRWGRDGVEAQRQLLVNGAVGVEKNMRRIAVDTREPDERDGHPRLLGDLADHRLGGGFADLDPPGQLPIAVIDPTDQKDLAGPLRTGANAAGSTSCARSAFGSW